MYVLVNLPQKYQKDGERKIKRKKISGIAPLQPPTLASFRTWGI